MKDSARYKGIRGIISPFRDIVARHGGALALSVTAMIFIDIFAYSFPILIRYVTDTIYPAVQAGAPTNELWLYGSLFLLLSLVRGILVHLMIRGFWYVGESVVRDIRNALFEKLQHLEAPFYDRSRTGDLMSRVSSDVQMIRNFFAFGIEHRIRVILISATVLVLMLFQNWRLALLVYSFIPLVLYLVYYFSTRMGRAVKIKHEQTGTLASFLQENLRGIRIVKALAAEEDQIRKFDRENASLRDTSMDVADLQARLNPLLVVTNTVGSLVIIAYGGWQILSGQGGTTLGTLLGFLSFLGIMGFPVNILAFNTSLMNLASGASRRIDEILRVNEDQRKQNLGNFRGCIKGELEFRQVNFSYTHDNPVLEEISFSINAGEKVAIFGLTGSGKSSLINLIPRFYEPDKGEIILDGVPLRNYELEYLRSRIGMVLQESFLFSMSIMDNIAYGKPSADMEEVIRAAKAARIHDAIMAMPKGYDSMVGEFGIGLSGGQKQRIAIARALLKDPRLLILDDCTSSLDRITEKEIQDELRTLMAGRTTLIIAQRITTLQLADRIILLHDGKVHHMDSHEELLKKSSLYRSAYEAQMMYSPVAEDGLTWRPS